MEGPSPLSCPRRGRPAAPDDIRRRRPAARDREVPSSPTGVAAIRSATNRGVAVLYSKSPLHKSSDDAQRAQSIVSGSPNIAEWNTMPMRAPRAADVPGRCGQRRVRRDAQDGAIAAGLPGTPDGADVEVWGRRGADRGRRPDARGPAAADTAHADPPPAATRTSSTTRACIGICASPRDPRG